MAGLCSLKGGGQQKPLSRIISLSPSFLCYISVPDCTIASRLSGRKTWISSPTSTRSKPTRECLVSASSGRSLTHWASYDDPPPKNRLQAFWQWLVRAPFPSHPIGILIGFLRCNPRKAHLLTTPHQFIVISPLMKTRSGLRQSLNTGTSTARRDEAKRPRLVETRSWLDGHPML